MNSLQKCMVYGIVALGTHVPVYADEESVFEDLFRSPELQSEHRSPPTLKTKLTNGLKGTGYLTVWGGSAAALVFLLDLFQNFPMANEKYREIIRNKLEGDELRRQEFIATIGLPIAQLFVLSLAVGVMYMNIKLDVQGKVVQSFKKSIE
jgi:hypothetical protein